MAQKYLYIILDLCTSTKLVAAIFLKERLINLQRQPLGFASKDPRVWIFIMELLPSIFKYRSEWAHSLTKFEVTYFLLKASNLQYQNCCPPMIFC